MDKKYMQRCLDLAILGLGKASANPMVGAVIVYQNRMIGEGYHQYYGGPHAEVNAIQSVLLKDRHLLKKATMYVSLEPCSFYGKTPPCADLLIREQIPKVIIGCIDPHPRVTGNGIQKLKAAGIEVTTGLLAEKGEWLNRRFNTFMRKKRPYVILKWAQTKNGFFASKSGKQQWITNDLTKRLSHRWRTEEDAILVGTNTALMDNPQLTARLWEGKQPLRLVIDRTMRLPKDLHLFDESVPTIVFKEGENLMPEEVNAKSKNLKVIHLNFGEDITPQLLNHLYLQDIQSVIVEGGAQLLNSFMVAGLWDEIRVLEGADNWKEGVKAPDLQGAKLIQRDSLGDNEMRIYIKNGI